MNHYKFFKNDSIFREQAESCVKFFEELTNLLEDYETIGTGKFPKNYFVEHADNNIFRLQDKYLIPIGTKSQITYYSKPKWSFRISDHWNWFDKKNCKQKGYIQCFNVNLPRLPYRFEEGEDRSSCCNAIQVAIFTHDNVKKGHDGEAYHCVYGSYKNKDTHSWEWMEKTPQQVIEEYCLA